MPDRKPSDVSAQVARRGTGVACQQGNDDPPDLPGHPLSLLPLDVRAIPPAEWPLLLVGVPPRPGGPADIVFSEVSPVHS